MLTNHAYFFVLLSSQPKPQCEREHDITISRRRKTNKGGGVAKQFAIGNRAYPFFRKLFWFSQSRSVQKNNCTMGGQFEGGGGESFIPMAVITPNHHSQWWLKNDGHSVALFSIYNHFHFQFRKMNLGTFKLCSIAQLSLVFISEQKTNLQQP